MAANETLARDDAPPVEHVGATTRSLLGRFARQFANSAISFDVTLPDRSVQRFGPGASE